MMVSDIKTAMLAHIRKNWPSAKPSLMKWTIGGILTSIPEFLVCKIPPSEDYNSWVYISVGASKFLNAQGEHLEFALVAPYDSAEHIETLAMVAHFHSDPNFRLELGSVVDIGHSWVENSKCDHLLLDLPYFKGANFENLVVDKHCVRVLWLVPISKSEYNYIEKNGIDAFQDVLEQQKIRVSDPFRDTLF